jgi:hypothetical protein
MGTMNLCLLLFGVYNIDNFQTILVNFLLFHNNINDIGDKLLSLSRLFADDTSLGYASQDEAQIEYVINHDLHELGDWSNRWYLSIIFLIFAYSIYISIYATSICVWIHFLLNFLHVYSILLPR